MKFKEIKPGMVIHCWKKEEKEALAKYLMARNDLDFIYTDPKDEVGYFFFVCDIDGRPEDVTDDEITEFSDLIEPDNNTVNLEIYKGGKLHVTIIGKEDAAKTIDSIRNFLENSTQNSTDGEKSTDSPMSAVEVLEWIRKYECTETMFAVFAEMDADGVFANYTAQEVIDKITAYEAAKKVPKPVELEWVNYCKIVDYQSGECVQETELEKGVKKVPVENLLKQYVTHHDGDYYATVERRCRVKGE